VKFMANLCYLYFCKSYNCISSRPALSRIPGSTSRICQPIGNRCLKRCICQWLVPTDLHDTNSSGRLINCRMVCCLQNRSIPSERMDVSYSYCYFISAVLQVWPFWFRPIFSQLEPLTMWRNFDIWHRMCTPHCFLRQIRKPFEI
jgi:hypothetical protein